MTRWKTARVLAGLLFFSFLFAFQAAASEISLDFDVDGKVNNADLLLLLKNEGAVRGEEEYDPRFDLNQDGQIGSADVILFVNRWKVVASPRTPISPEDLREKIKLADGVKRVWDFAKRTPGDPYGYLDHVVATLEPTTVDGISELVQGWRPIDVYFPQPKGVLLLSAEGDLRVMQVELPKDIPLVTGVAISKDSKIFSAPVPLTSSGMIQSGSTVTVAGTSQLDFVAGPEKQFKVPTEVPYSVESTFTDMSEDGDWSTVYAGLTMEATMSTYGPFVGGTQIVFDEEGPLFYQNYYSTQNREKFQAVERIETGPYTCESEVEPNNQVAEGGMVHPPDCRKGNMAGDHLDLSDFFRIEATETANVRVRLDRAYANDVTLTLRDPGGGILQSESLSGDIGGFPFDPVQMAPGDVYSFEVQIPDSPSGFGYTVHFDVIPDTECDPETEPNDDFATANGILLNECYTGQVGEGADEYDNYRVSVPAGQSGPLRVFLTHDAAQDVDGTGILYELFPDGSDNDLERAYLLRGQGIRAFDRVDSIAGREFALELKTRGGSMDYEILFQVP